MTLSAIHNGTHLYDPQSPVVCDIGGYDFVSYSQRDPVYKLCDRSCL